MAQDTPAPLLPIMPVPGVIFVGIATPVGGPAVSLMNPQRFLRTIDGTWTGMVAAWPIIALTTLVCAEVFKRYKA